MLCRAIVIFQNSNNSFSQNILIGMLSNGFLIEQEILFH